jgi:hypothetical protein
MNARLDRCGRRDTSSSSHVAHVVWRMHPSIRMQTSVARLPTIPYHAATIDCKRGTGFQSTDEGRLGRRLSYRRCSSRVRRCSFRILLPSIPESREREQFTIADLEDKRLFACWSPTPFVKSEAAMG